MKFSFNECFLDNTKFDGLLEIQPTVFSDDRGSNIECWNLRDFSQAGITLNFVQDNQSISKKGVYRGLHFQKNRCQAKLVRCVFGGVIDVVVDLRNGSQTFGKSYAVILDGQKQNMLYIPKGFAHGFITLNDNSILSYKCSDFYAPEDEGGIMWDWKFLGDYAAIGTVNNISSQKDQLLEPFSATKKYFDMNGNWIGD